MMRILLAGVLMLACVGCNSDEAARRGAPSGLAALDPALAEDCPAGGYVVRLGVDADGDGTISEAESTNSIVLCHGEDGARGPMGTAGPAGSEGSGCTASSMGNGSVTVACGDGSSASVDPLAQLAGSIYTVDESVTNAGCAPLQVAASCAPGDVLLSGGCSTPADQWYLRRSIPVDDSWSCRAVSASDCVSTVLTARARCLASTSSTTEFDPVEVQASAGWVDSGIAVQAGNTLSIAGSGLAAAAGETPYIDPDGNPWVPSTAPNTLAPLLQRYALVARVGGGTPFLVGSSVEHQSAASGTLEFAFNDESSSFGDNTGAFAASVTLSP